MTNFFFIPNKDIKENPFHFKILLSETDLNMNLKELN